MEMTQVRTSRQKATKAAMAAALGGLCGFVGMFAIMRLTDGAGVDDLDGSTVVALGVALIYVLMGVFCGLGAMLPGLGSKVLNVEDEEELREQRALLGYSSAGILALGVALALAALAGPVGMVPDGIALAGVVVSIAAAVWLTFVQMRGADELLRAVSRETAAAAFYLIALVGGGWSLLAHFAWAAAPASLDWLSMLWGLMLLAAFVATGRRGMLAPR
ncbi:hypothetical protein [Tsuneonella sp. HG222]